MSPARTPDGALDTLEDAAAMRCGEPAGLRLGLLRLAGIRLAAAAALRLVGDGLGLAPPLAVYAIVRFVQAPPTVDASFAAQNFGYVVGAALFLASALRAVCLHLHRRLVNRVATRARSALTALVLDKAMTLSAQSTRAVGGAPAIVELATVEAGRVRDLLATIDSLIAAPLQLSLGMVLLIKLLGVRSSFAGVAALVAVVSPVTYAVKSKLAVLSDHVTVLSEQRIALLTELFQHIRVIKICAWEPPLLARVEAVRTLELQSLRGMIAWSALQRMLAVLQTGPMVAAIAAFAVFVCVQASPLTSDIAFPAIVLFAILETPIVELPKTVAVLVQGCASVRRIETFVAMEEFKPLALTPRAPTPAPTSPMRPHRDDPPFELRSAVFRLDWVSSRALRTISSRDLTSSSSAGATKALTRLSVVIPRGKLTLVVGSPGSGKSTLLTALVGELAPESGFVNLPRAGTVSFAPQTPFIMTGRSIQDNILFGALLDQGRLDAVLEACELDGAVATLPKRLLTVVGDAEKGFWSPDESLRQRIALARAVYAWDRTELFVVDDALSSIDPDEARQVLDRCMLGTDALLAGTTRVLSIDAAVNPNALELVRAADWIVVMDQGKAAQAGSFADLSTLQPYGRFAQMLTALEAAKRVENVLSESTGDDEEPGASRRSHSSSSSSSTSRRRSSTFSAQESPKPVHWLEEEDSGASWSAFASYWSACGSLVVAGASGALVAAQLSAVSMDLWLANWTGNTSSPSFSSRVPLEAVSLSIYAYLGLTTLVLTCVGDVVARYAGLGASKAIHVRLLRHVTKGSMRFFDAAPLDRVLVRFSSDMAAIDRSLISAIVERVGRTLALMSMLVVQLSVAPVPLLALLAPVLACYVPLHAHFGPRLRVARRLESDSTRGVASSIAQALQGVSTIRVFDMAAAARRQLALVVAADARASSRTTALDCWLNAQLDGLGAVLALVVTSIVASGQPGQPSDAMAGLVLVYALYSARVLRELTRDADAVGDAMISAKRVKALCSARLVDTEPLVLPPPVPAHEVINDRPPWSAVLALRPQWPERGQLNLINVSVTPAPGPSSPSLGPRPVLRGVSLAIKGGAKVGVCAADGSVERARALLWALLRLEPTSGGRIEIDGVPAAQLDLRDLRARLAVVPREPLVFAGESVRFNLDPAARASDDELWTAVRSAGIDKAAVGTLDALCSDEWGRRLWLARALLRRPRVLLVDASADEGDDGMVEAARSLPALKDATVLALAWRATSLADYDQVIVLDAGGRVAEHGPPSRLLRDRPDGAFARLLDGSPDWTPAV